MCLSSIERTCSPQEEMTFYKVFRIWKVTVATDKTIEVFSSLLFRDTPAALGVTLKEPSKKHLRSSVCSGGPYRVGFHGFKSLAGARAYLGTRDQSRNAIVKCRGRVHTVGTQAVYERGASAFDGIKVRQYKAVVASTCTLIEKVE